MQPAWLSVSGPIWSHCARSGGEDKVWQPQIDETERARGFAGWQKAVERTLNWEE